MKKGLITLSLVLFCSTTALFAQGELDAYRMSQTDLKGTARSVSMGGAFGALGGDISAISINPAGIGIYTGSEVATTMNFRSTNSKADLTGISKEVDKFKFSFDNVGFVTSVPLFSDAVPRINFGFSYNKLKSFDRKVRMEGNGLPGSLTDYMAYRANISGLTDYVEDSPRKWETHDWMGLFGFNTFLVNYDEVDKRYVSSLGSELNISNLLNLREKGYINTYDFNMGATISDILSLGLTISVTDIDYKLYSFYEERFENSNGNIGNFSFRDRLSTEGAGWQVALGAILKPIDELRIGISYHSPTWYNMEDFTDPYLYHNLTPLIGGNGQNIDPNYNGDHLDQQGRYEYELTTPGKWTFSLASVIGSKAIISLDYDLVDYTQMKLKDRYWGDYSIEDSGVNDRIKDNFKLASTLRIGGEYRITPQLSARAGYSWVQSPMEDNFKYRTEDDIEVEEVVTAGTSSPFIKDGDKHYITWGLGYRFSKNFYTDVAFVYRQQKDDLYAFSNVKEDNIPVVESLPAKLKTTGFQGLVTLGFRF